MKPNKLVNTASPSQPRFHFLTDHPQAWALIPQPVLHSFVQFWRCGDFGIELRAGVDPQVFVSSDVGIDTRLSANKWQHREPHNGH